ncbi:MAG: UDP-N-acetylmuramoyl-L-alanyl-D-glutamate--2,6-diaminopimelate ligase, partial [Firmicutes bacterium]|nr:UDP-N-acetylmuramoyl-L-alanyl-D-glutamate--2,6-diaminopimelate ligase [Bacillota bacterium]
LKNGATVIVSQQALPLPVALIITADTRHFLSFFSDRYFGHPSHKLDVTGITGTNGKTTTAHFLYEIYQAAGKKSALMGTVGIKAAGQSRKQSLTTPGAEELHNTLWQLEREGMEHVAMEVSSHALVQKRVEHCRFHAAIFTNLTREHLDYHQTMDDYFQAKAHLFALIRGSASNAIINADDRRAELLQQQLTSHMLTYGIEKEADVKALEIRPLTDGGSYVKALSPWGELSFAIRLHGLYNIYNALAAASAALMDNISLSAVERGIAALKLVPGRLELLPSPPGVRVYLDYAHTPDALEKVLQAVSDYPHQRIILVFGCRGQRDSGKRPLMGAIAERYADITILTADNPIDENPAAIAKDIAHTMVKKPFYIDEREEAIYYALTLAGDGDIVLITGKGREDYQLIGNSVIPYSDLNVVYSYVNHPLH